MEGWEQTIDSDSLLSRLGYSLESSFVYTSLRIKNKTQQKLPQTNRKQQSKPPIFKLVQIVLNASMTAYLVNNVFWSDELTSKNKWCTL